MQDVRDVEFLTFETGALAANAADIMMSSSQYCPFSCFMTVVDGMNTVSS
jgi:hypothetical protein